MKQCVQYELHLCIGQFLSGQKQELWCHSLVNMRCESYVRSGLTLRSFIFQKPRSPWGQQERQCSICTFTIQCSWQYSLVSAFMCIQDSASSAHYAQWLSVRIKFKMTFSCTYKNNSYLDLVCFSDEATFHACGDINNQIKIIFQMGCYLPSLEKWIFEGQEMWCVTLNLKKIWAFT
jgi:hypothetical protein